MIGRLIFKTITGLGLLIYSEISQAQLNPFLIAFSDSGMVCSGTGVAALPGGNLLYAGHEYAPSISPRIVLKKLNASGNELSTAVYAASGHSYLLNKMIYDHSQARVFLAGHTLFNSQTDGLVLVADTNGTLLNTFLFGNPNASESLNGLCLTADGGFAVIGYQGYTGSFSDFYVAKVSASGQIEWQYNYGTPLIDIGMNILQTADGGYMISGDRQVAANSYYNVMIKKLDNGGGEQYTLHAASPFNSGCRDMIKDAFGDFLIAGETATPTSAYFDILIIKFSSAGNLIWMKTIAGSDQGDAGFSITEYAAGRYLLTGYYFITQNNNTAQFMALCDSSGSVLDFRTYDFVPMIDIGYQIARVNGGFYIAGSSIWLENKFTLAFDTLSVASGISMPVADPVTVFPNPVKSGDKLYVNTALIPALIELYDVSGRLISAIKLHDNQNHLLIPGQLPEGVYTLRLRNRTANSIIKIKVLSKE